MAYFEFPDPSDAMSLTAASLASPILDLPGHLAASASGMTQRIADSLLAGIPDIATAAIAVADGWSESGPQEWLRVIQTGMTDIESSARTATAACLTLAEAVDSAKAEANEALSAAEAELSRCDAIPVPTPLPFGIDPLLPQRRAIISRLRTRLSTIETRLANAATLFEQTLGTLPDLARMAAIADQGAGPTVDRENRQQLLSDLRDGSLREQLFAAAIQTALNEAASKGLTPRLLTYRSNDTDGQGGVAIAIGDLERATDVAVLVPGITNSPMDIAQSIPRAAELNASAMSDGTTVAATVLWFDANIPLSWPSDVPMIDPLAQFALAGADSLTALGDGQAQAAGARLAGFTTWLHDGLLASTDISLVGFSNGATTISYAAQLLPPSAGVRDIVLVGGPGAGGSAQLADDFTAVNRDHAYVMSLPSDPVPSVLTDQAAWLGGALAAVAGIPLNALGVVGPGHRTGQPYGADQNSRAFGAKIIDTGVTWCDPLPLELGAHSLENYLSGSRLDAVGAIVAGRYGEVPLR